MGRGSDRSIGDGRGVGGGTLSAWVLFALSVQVSLSALAWGGPGSADTRLRLATAMVAAAHRGVYCEPTRHEASVFGQRAERPAVVGEASSSASCETPKSAWVVERGWVSAVPPPMA
jgi:hypothetical protein